MQAIQTYAPRQLRTRASKPTQPEMNKSKTEKELKLLTQLDETHQRRLTALQAAAAYISSSSSSSTQI